MPLMSDACLSLQARVLPYPRFYADGIQIQNFNHTPHKLKRHPVQLSKTEDLIVLRKTALLCVHPWGDYHHPKPQT